MNKKIVLVILFILLANIGIYFPIYRVTASVIPGGIAYVYYYWPIVPQSENQTGYYNFDIDITIEIEPKKVAYYYWAHQFKFVDSNEGGYLGLQKIGNEKKLAIFSIWGAKGGRAGEGGKAQPFTGEGDGWQCLLPFEWKENTTYTLRVLELCCADNENEDETWAAWVIDQKSKQEFLIGEIIVPASYMWLDSWSTSWVEYFAEVDDCESLPEFSMSFTNIIANAGEFKPEYNSITKGKVCDNIEISEIENGYKIKTKKNILIKPPVLISPCGNNSITRDSTTISDIMVR